MRVALNTLGCRLNEAELESWSNDFRQLGYSISRDTESADIVVVNTCAVTREAVKKSRQLIRKSQRVNPRAKLVVSGCYASLKPELTDEIEGIDLLVNNREKDSLARIVNEQLNEYTMPSIATEAGENSLFPRRRTRAFVKVQDGCRYRCTFCIVTVARGEERSKPVQRIISEINNLYQQDVKEVVLTGVHLGGYGSDMNNSLYSLVQSILAETDIPRVRLGSVEPWDLGDEFPGLFSNPRFMPHLHLPLQSGCDSVLRRMGRRCMTGDYDRLVNELRSAVENFTLTTDIIAGFPGENDAEWQDSLEFIEDCRFSHVHIFPYSPRQGTRAASLPGQVSSATKKSRTGQLDTLAKRMRAAVMQEFSGFEFPVLLEDYITLAGNGARQYLGYTPNFLKVKFISDDPAILTNRIQTIQLADYDEHAMLMNAGTGGACSETPVGQDNEASAGLQ